MRVPGQEIARAGDRVVDVGRIDIEVGHEAQADQAGGEHAAGLEMVEQRRTLAIGHVDEDDVGLRRAHAQAVDAGQALREARSKVTLATQGSYDSLFAADLPGGLSLELRLLVALYAAVLTPQAELAAHYRERLQAEGVTPAWLAAVEHDTLSGLDDPRLQAVLGYTRTLIVAPREGDRAALQGLLARLLAGKSAQLAGCHFLFHRARLLAFREAKAVGPAVAGAQVWDNRWRCPNAPADCEIRALGADGLAQAKLWRRLGLPRAALLSARHGEIEEALMTALERWEQLGGV